MRKWLTICLLAALLVPVLVGTKPVLADPDPDAPELLLTELVVTPTAGEFVEIHNPTGTAIDLTDVYLTDATYAGGGTYYYNIVTGSNAGGGSYYDFHARFPNGASIAVGEYQTIALNGSDNFLTEYGVNPTYELYEDGASADGIPDMREALAGSINNQGGLSNGGEVVILYFWDGQSDLVTDLDYAVWGDKDEAVDKSGVSIDGPDADASATDYLDDTAITLQDTVAGGAHAYGSSWQHGDLTEGVETATGGNGVGGDDETSEDLSSTWCEDSPTPGAATSCGPPPPPPVLTIMEIQGDGASSSFHGDVVVTEGIVTVDLQKGSELKGFFIQDRFGDGDPATSDGLFVNHSDYWSPSFDPSVGDLVRVQGTIDEQYGLTQMESLDAGTICGTGYQPVATNVFARDFNANAESYESMYVRFPRQMFVTDTYNQHRYGEVWLAEKGVVEQPTNEYPVGPDSAALAADNMARSVLLDDSSTGWYPDPVPYTGAEGTLRLGYIVKNPLVGAINYSYSYYRIQPQDPASVRFVPQNARPVEPTTYGNLVVASANVLNYWTTLGGRGADTPEQLEVQTEKLVAELRGTGADVIGLQEIENDSSHTPITTLVEALNAAEGSDVWSWIGEHEANVYPIRNEIIYRNDRVETVGDPVTVIDPIFDNIPPDRTDPIGRRPVAQTFTFNGETFTVVNNHFKSKGCTGAAGDDLDQGDGQSCFNATRVGQAERVLELVDELVADTDDPDVIVIGDLNAYLDEDPVLAFEAELVNLVREWDKDPYSYNFFATFAAPWIGRGLLDHALATPSMADLVKRAEVWHINADEPRFLD
ncbi:MAG: ExeM/NucH family extracellular endonuclease, partial [Anaerolineae bacterium]